MAIAETHQGQSVVLDRVSWKTYESLLLDLADRSAPRLTFDRGTLEIMSPRPELERFNRTLAQLVEILSEELSVETENLGSTTFRREDLDRGFEPDSCFYVQNAERVRGKERIDLTVDPPPDLVIEIDITHPSIGKMALFSVLGVPEVWRFDGARITIEILSGGQYASSRTSQAFPVVTAEVLDRFVRLSREATRLTVVRSFRDWLRQARS